MKLEAAIEACEGWLAHLERQTERTIALQKASRLARDGNVDEARKIKSRLDRAPVVYDGATLEPAVRALLAHVRK